MGLFNFGATSTNKTQNTTHDHRVIASGGGVGVSTGDNATVTVDQVPHDAFTLAEQAVANSFKVAAAAQQLTKSSSNQLSSQLINMLPVAAIAFVAWKVFK